MEVEKQNTPETQEKADREAQAAAATWVGEHRSDNREHLTYRLVTSVPYRIVPGEWL
nr:hypothetical protein [Streptomyces pacificus]